MWSNFDLVYVGLLDWYVFLYTNFINKLRFEKLDKKKKKWKQINMKPISLLENNISYSHIIWWLVKKKNCRTNSLFLTFKKKSEADFFLILGNDIKKMHPVFFYHYYDIPYFIFQFNWIPEKKNRDWTETPNNIIIRPLIFQI